jgi:hypothetical protein
LPSSTEQLADRVGGLRVYRARLPDLDFDGGGFGIRGASADRELRGGRAHIGPLAALDIDEHMAAMLLQHRELMIGAQMESLEHERRFGPRAVERGYVHAELQFVHGQLFGFHGYFKGSDCSTRAARYPAPSGITSSLKS